MNRIASRGPPRDYLLKDVSGETPFFTVLPCNLQCKALFLKLGDQDPPFQLPYGSQLLKMAL